MIIKISSSVHVVRIWRCAVKRREVAIIANKGRITLTTTVVTELEEYILERELLHSKASQLAEVYFLLILRM